jgi:3-hydroxyacyl-[acyl-carrier-protein] dehydratase
VTPSGLPFSHHFSVFLPFPHTGNKPLLMLEGDFFHILSRQGPDADPSVPGTRNLKVTVRLNPAHRIFEGHFPGNPVVPGVCQIQMAREALESSLGRKGALTWGDQVKYLSLIVPQQHPVLDINYKIREPEPGHLDYSAVISEHETVFFKFRGILCIKPS